MFEHLKDQQEASTQLLSTIKDAVQGQLNEVIRGVAETKSSTENVFAIANQLKDLERVLKSQKQRGLLGERTLEFILSNMLPANSYKIQYQFPGGPVVDAAIMAKEGIIPVDAKFPLENYMRILDAPDESKRLEYEKEFMNDLRLRIDETAKYVRPSDGTLDFAFMFIPAEAIYYDLLVNEVGAVKSNTQTQIEYAYNKKKVIIVSPTTFAAYLHTVLYGFKAFQMEQAAKEIAKNVDQLGRHLNAFDEYFRRLGNTLSTTVNHFNAASKELGKVDKDVLKITGEKAGLEVQTIE
jgi:DNA recombination protein RmuC